MLISNSLDATWFCSVEYRILNIIIPNNFEHRMIIAINILVMFFCKMSLQPPNITSRQHRLQHNHATHSQRQDSAMEVSITGRLNDGGINCNKRR